MPTSMATAMATATATAMATATATAMATARATAMATTMATARAILWLQLWVIYIFILIVKTSYSIHYNTMAFEIQQILKQGTLTEREGSVLFTSSLSLLVLLQK